MKNGYVLIDNYIFQQVNSDEILTDIERLALVFQKYKETIKIKSESGIRSEN